MKIRIQIVRIVLLVLVCLTIAACGKIEITNPDETRQNLTVVPFDLVVEHSGCGQPLLEITAWLDRGTDKEQDISSAFEFDGGHTWSALACSLPLGSHALEVDPSVYWGQACFNFGGAARREFVVHESTCIKGKLYTRSSDDGSLKPVPFENVTVNLADGKEVVALGRTDANGDFCLDGIPVGHFIDVTFFSDRNFEPHLTNVNMGPSPHSCANQDCPDVCDHNPDKCQDGCYLVEYPRDN